MLVNAENRINRDHSLAPYATRTMRFLRHRHLRAEQLRSRTQAMCATHPNRLDCEPHSHRFKQCSQASEFRITARRKCPVERRGIKMRRLRQLRHPAKRFSHAAKRKQQLTLIAVFEYRIKVLCREFGIVAKARYCCVVLTAVGQSVRFGCQGNLLWSSSRQSAMCARRGPTHSARRQVPALQLCIIRPAPGSMQHTQNFDITVAHSIRNDVGQAANNKLACSNHASGAA